MNRIQSYFCYLAAVVLFCLAALNLLAASCPATVLNDPDSLLPLSNRWVLWLSGGAELITSAYLLAGKNSGAKLLWLAWLTTNLAVYRAGLWQADAANFGACLGNYLDWFLIKPRTMAVAATLLLGFLLAGSYGLIIASWVKDRKPCKIESLPVVVQPSL